MKLSRTTSRKSLLVIASALLLALVLQPVAAFAEMPRWNVTYTTDGNGEVSPTSETTDETSSKPRGTIDGESASSDKDVCVATIAGNMEVHPKEGFEFDYWTADVDIYDTWPGSEWLMRLIPANTPLETEELCTPTDPASQLYVAENTVFTAHFKPTGGDPEPEPVDPDGGDESGDTDGSDTIKPTGDTDGTDTIKLTNDTHGEPTPKTGDTLPSATAAVVLGAGVVVAGAALLRKRCQRD